MFGKLSQIAINGQRAHGLADTEALALLDRIILASSNEGDVVMDPFAGCSQRRASVLSCLASVGWHRH